MREFIRNLLGRNTSHEKYHYRKRRFRQLFPLSTADDIWRGCPLTKDMHRNTISFLSTRCQSGALAQRPGGEAVCSLPFDGSAL